MEQQMQAGKIAVAQREIKFRVWTGREMINDIIIQHYKLYPIMQYTGLKDKNGKEIYEGDIVKGPTGYIFNVLFNEGSFKICSNESHPLKNTMFLMNGPEWLVVIGNIYENPELL